MTASSSATWPTTLRSWVTKTSDRPRVGAQVRQQGEDLGLDRHVEGGRRLVAEQDRRVGGEGDGDHDPLAGAPRQLVRVGAVAAFGIGDPDLAQELERPLS